MIIQNMSQCGCNGKFKNYWKQKVHVIVSSVGENPVECKGRLGDDPKRNTENSA